MRTVFIVHAILSHYNYTVTSLQKHTLYVCFCMSYKDQPATMTLDKIANASSLVWFLTVAEA